jgi:hypothetical protein
MRIIREGFTELQQEISLVSIVFYANTVGAISVAPLCILSRPFELNNVDLI